MSGKHAHRVRKGDACLREGVWLGQVRMNALLVKRGEVGWDK